MKVALHIVWKDARRLRWPIAAWLVVVAAKLALGFTLVLGGGAAQWSTAVLERLTGTGFLVERVMTFVLAAMLVHGDLLVGSNQFWLTRPISGARLLGAKIAGGLLLLWLPEVLLTLPWWLTCGFGVKEMAQAAGEMLLVLVAVAVPAALVAALTDTLGRFLMWSFVLLFGAMTVPAILATMFGARMSGDSFGAHAIAGWTTLVVAAGAVIAHQFVRRDSGRSLRWLGAGVLLAALVAVQLPVTWVKWLTPQETWSDWHAERASGVALEFESFSSYTPNADARFEDRLSAYFTVKGKPGNLLVVGGLAARQTWRWPGLPELVREGGDIDGWDNTDVERTALGVRAPQRDEETERFYARLREERRGKNLPAIPPNSRPAAQVRVEVGVLSSTVTRMRKTPAAYTASIQLRLLRPEVLMEVPLLAGGWHARAAHGFRVGPVQFGTRTSQRGAGDAVNTGNMPVVVTRPGLWLDTWRENRRWSDEWRRPGLMVVHRAGGELQSDWWTRRSSFRISGVGLQCASLRVWRPMVRRGDKWVLRDEAWQAGATAMMVAYREEARFTREVTAERFEAKQTRASP